MNSGTRKKALVFLIVLAILMTAEQAILAASVVRPAELPNPIAVLLTPAFFQQDGKQWTRYNLSVFNYNEYPKEMFAAAPSLPPCGQNTKAARTWVEIMDQSGKRLYGFCALSSNNDLTKLWFALESEKLPPSWVYVVLNDRQTGKTYKSNLVETTE
jgi:hypothetical protein